MERVIKTSEPPTQPELKERALVDRETLGLYRYVAQQLTEHGIGNYAVLENPQDQEVNDPEKIDIVVVSPVRRSDAFWETARKLIKGLRETPHNKTADTKVTIVAGEIARIKAEAFLYSTDPSLRNPNRH